MITIESDSSINAIIDTYICKEMADNLVFEDAQLDLFYNYNDESSHQLTGFNYNDVQPPAPNWQYNNFPAANSVDSMSVQPSHYYDNGTIPNSYYYDVPSQYATIDQYSSFDSPITSPDSYRMSPISSDGSLPYDHNSPLPSPTRGRGRPRKLKVGKNSEKVRRFRLKKKILDEQSQTYGWKALYHGICNEVMISTDYETAVNKIVASQNWGPQFLTKICWCKSTVPTRGRRRSDCLETERQQRREYNRCYNAQRKPGVFFLLLCDVLCQLKEKNPAIYKRIVAEIKSNCLNLYDNIIGCTGNSRHC